MQRWSRGEALHEANNVRTMVHPKAVAPLGHGHPRGSTNGRISTRSLKWNRTSGGHSPCGIGFATNLEKANRNQPKPTAPRKELLSSAIDFYG